MIPSERLPPKVRVNQRSDDPATLVLSVEPKGCMSRQAQDYLERRVQERLIPLVGQVLDLSVCRALADAVVSDALRDGWLRPGPRWARDWLVVL